MQPTDQTSEEQVLWDQAVNPDDLHAALVYSDWLRDRGRDREADFWKAIPELRQEMAECNPTCRNVGAYEMDVGRGTVEMLQRRVNYEHNCKTCIAVLRLYLKERKMACTVPFNRSLPRRLL
jgi:uncharacterized protein (TIGR02996 family)